jgi:hypothetical protein
MHTHRSAAAAGLMLAALGLLANGAQPPSTVVAGSGFAWGANVGWIDWRADGTQSGAVFANPFFASGSIWSPNIGWISLGNGVPANHQSYSNASGSDFGVNIDAFSDPQSFLLSGLGWSANCGWISFDKAEAAWRPRIDKQTGVLHGFAWGANIGWIALDPTGQQIKTGLLARNAADGDWTLYR